MGSPVGHFWESKARLHRVELALKTKKELTKQVWDESPGRRKEKTKV